MKPLNYALVLVLLALFLAHGLRAQAPPSMEWEKVMGGSDKDVQGFVGLASSSFARAQVATDTAGNTYVATTTKSSDGWVKKNNQKIEVDSLGNTDTSNTFDIWLLKLSPAGDTLWTRVIGGTGRDKVMDIALLADGDLLLCGQTISQDGDFTQPTNNRRKADAFVARLHPDGSNQWILKYGGSEIDELYQIEETLDGNLLFCGQTGSVDGELTGNTNAGSVEAWALKLRPNGRVLWSETAFLPEKEAKATPGLPYSKSDWLEAFWSIAEVEVFGDTAYYFLGNAGHFFGGGTTDLYVVRFSQDGEEVWSQGMGSYQDDQPATIFPGENGNFFFLGSILQGDTGEVEVEHIRDHDMWLANNIDISTQEQYNLGTEGNDFLIQMRPRPGGGYLAVGIQDTIPGDSSALGHWMQVLDEDFQLQQQFYWGGSQPDGLTDIAFGPEKNTAIIVGKVSSPEFEGFQGEDDLYVAKVDLSTVASLPGEQQRPSLRVFPNPARERLQVEGLASGSRLRLWNTAGQAVGKQKTVQGSRAQLELGQLSPGLYLLEVQEPAGQRIWRKVLIR